jgi:4-hydroxybenzoate polyprenyltransferase
MNTSKTVQINSVKCKTCAIKQPAKVFSLRFIKAYIITMRPYLLFVSGITGIAGLSFARVTSVAVTLILGFAFFLSYGFGQALTDCFQMDTDSLSSPYRPLVHGEVRKKDILIVSISGLIAIGVVISINNYMNFVLTLIAALGLATYTFFKRRWWGGPFYNSWIVMLLCIIAYLSGRASSLESISRLAFVSALVMVFFGYANFVLTGYYKDISADRMTGYNTLPVVFGLKVSAVVSDLFALFAAAGCILSIHAVIDFSSETWFGFLIFLVPGVAALVIGQIQLHRTYKEADSHKAIVPVVHTYILMLSAISSANKPLWTAPLVLFYAAFIFTMKFRPMRQQI